MKALQSRRIDRIYLSERLLARVKSTTYKLNTISDHIFMQQIQIITPNNIKWGHGIWKNDTRHLQDEELYTKIEETHQRCTEQKCFFNDVYQWWDYLKKEMKKQLKSHSWQKKAENENKIKALQEKVSRIQNEQNPDENPTDALKELKRLEDEEIRHQCQLHKIKDIEENEKPTRYFFQKLQQRRESKIFSSIVNEHGAEITTKEEILHTVERFYTDLWSESKNANPDLQTKYLDTVKDIKITPDQREDLKTPITEDEIKIIIQKMDNGKTPGPDGLAKEFYVAYYNLIKSDLQEVLNNSYLFGGICQTWSDGTTTMVYKKGSPQELKNWRPITLLNTDYKILTAILSARLTPILPNIINGTQKCGIKGRDITDVLRNTHAAIKYARERGKELLVVNLDQEKAFDKINHQYLHKILAGYDLPSHFTKLIKNIYSEASSRILVNGALTNKIKLGRGIRQGCPLSMSLYAICSDPLARLIEKNPNTEAFRIGGIKMKIQQYADDLTCYLTREKDIDLIIQEFGRCERATGQKLNAQKTRNFAH